MMSTRIPLGAKTTGIISVVRTVWRRTIPKPAHAMKVTPNVLPSNIVKTKATLNLHNHVMTSGRLGIRISNARTGLTGIKNAGRIRLRPAKTTVMSTTVPVPTRPNYANGIPLMPNAATIRHPRIVLPIRKSPAVRAVPLSVKIHAVTTADNAARPPVRADTTTLMRRLRAGRQDILRTARITVTIAHAESSINAKKIPAPVIPPAPVTAV